VAALSIVVAPPFTRGVSLFVHHQFDSSQFFGGTILLASPLVVLSAMNPLLIALGRMPPRRDAGREESFLSAPWVVRVVLTAFSDDSVSDQLSRLVGDEAWDWVAGWRITLLNRDIAASGKKAPALLLW